MKEHLCAGLDRATGALVGLAVGDALGAPVEFAEPGTFSPVSEMRGGGPFNLEPGQWTDDTSMALCLAESLIVKNGFDPVDELERYLEWYRYGKYSSTGRCFGTGSTTRRALENFLKTGRPFSGPADPRSAGNGSLMRLAPVPLFFHREPELAIFYSGESSRTTHGAVNAIDACRFFGALIVGAIAGIRKDELLSPEFTPVPGTREDWSRRPLAEEIREVASGSYKRKNPPEIRGAGYVVRSLEAALWAFYHGESFSEAVLLAVNLGDDADTSGAITGQLAGAYYGLAGIPEEWRRKITMRETIEELAVKLFYARERNSPAELI